jgi:hypothetical protein
MNLQNRDGKKHQGKNFRKEKTSQQQLLEISKTSRQPFVSKCVRIKNIFTHLKPIV